MKYLSGLGSIAGAFLLMPKGRGLILLALWLPAKLDPKSAAAVLREALRLWVAR